MLVFAEGTVERGVATCTPAKVAKPVDRVAAARPPPKPDLMMRLKKSDPNVMSAMTRFVDLFSEEKGKLKIASPRPPPKLNSLKKAARMASPKTAGAMANLVKQNKQNEVRFFPLFLPFFRAF